MCWFALHSKGGFDQKYGHAIMAWYIEQQKHDCLRLMDNATPTPIRVLVVDDHPVLREGLAAMIGSQQDLVLVAEAETGSRAIEEFERHLPDVTLMDLRLPDISGIVAIQTIRSKHPDAKIVVLTTYSGDIQALRALQAGALGYLLKATLRRDLLDTIRTVYAGKRRVPPEVATDLAAHAMDDTLTRRETDVLKEIAAGCSNKIVADRLGIGGDTVKGHVRSILSKLGANDRTHAVTIGLRRGILEL